jgi:hypothetical protein
MLLFKIDTIVLDGTPLAFEDGSGMLSGAARFENEIVPSASGEDGARRRRVPTTLRARLQFANTTDVDRLAATSDVQITARDSQSGRRALLTKCMFGSMGEIGGGAVDVTFNVLAPIQWL